jgi:hypothetical protein
LNGHSSLLTPGNPQESKQITPPTSTPRNSQGWGLFIFLEI